MSRAAPLKGRAAHPARNVFDHALAHYFPKLLQTAQLEVGRRLTLGQCAPDNPTPELWELS
jgi:hypothetical protein